MEKKKVDFGIIFMESFEMIDDIQVDINIDMKFVHMPTWKVYEHYTINKKNITQQLGFFDTKFEYIPTTNNSLEKRRNDFHSYNLKAMTERIKPFVSIDLESAVYDTEVRII